MLRHSAGWKNCLLCLPERCNRKALCFSKRKHRLLCHPASNSGRQRVKQLPLPAHSAA